MAVLYGVNGDKRAVDVPPTKLPSNQDKGRLRVSYDQITLAAELTAADTVRFFKIPKGAKVYETFLSSPQLGSGGGNGELDLGYEANGDDIADPDAFYDGAEVGSAAFIGKMTDVISHAGIGYEFDEEGWVTLLANETTDAGIADVIEAWMWWALD